ncbi:MAG TPA: phytoene/squalene synthase family protein [Myxococcaceae bacterium]|nr:phytoene/squalene synthase family protein [Myxococcaceae bacterium]
MSRTFALNIPVLPPPLDLVVTVAYLLCRIADTLEDEARGQVSERAELFHTLGRLVKLEPGWEERASEFARRSVAALRPSAPSAEVQLVQGTRTVLEAMRGLPDWTHRHIAACVGEMTGGMAEVMEELDGGAPQGLPDLRDTLQYCYYVAGTVGVMLTGLFVDGHDSVRPKKAELAPRAPAFGRALQLTNILKDIREDLDRGFCWLPRTVMAKHGLSPGNLVLPERRSAAVAMLDELVAVARRECDVSFEYSLLLPRSEPGLRLFCLWPLLFALRTLRALAHNPAVFEPAPVKIDRQTVMRIMVLTRESVADDRALEALYAECARGLPEGRGA